MNTSSPQSPYPFLPSPRSYLTLASPPPLPSSILSPPLPTSQSTPALQSHRLHHGPPHHRNHNPTSPLERASYFPPPRALPSGRQQKEEDEDSLLTRTASVLALSALEQKGQSWLAARKSSTSLSLSPPTSPITISGEGYFPPTTARHPSHRSSAMSTPRASRSRHNSRRPSSTKSAPTPDHVRAADFDLREPFLEHEPGFNMRKGGRNNSAPAAAAAENEIRRLHMARAGGWLEWAIGWMDFRDDDDEPNENENTNPDNDLSGASTPYQNETGDTQPPTWDENKNTIKSTTKSASLHNPNTSSTKPTPRPGINQHGLRGEDTEEIESSKEEKTEKEEEEEEEVEGLDTEIPPLSPLPPSPLGMVETKTGKGDWDGNRDLWWGDAKWLFGVACRLAL